MKHVDLGAVVSYNDVLREVIGISEGKAIHMRLIDAEPCAHCGSFGDVTLLEHSPLFQKLVEPVKTVEER